MVGEFAAVVTSSHFAEPFLRPICAPLQLLVRQAGHQSRLYSLITITQSRLELDSLSFGQRTESFHFDYGLELLQEKSGVLFSLMDIKIIF